MPKARTAKNKPLAVRQTPHQCGYQCGEERCGEIVKASQPYCSRHSLARATAEQTAEAVLLGPEQAAALRAALGLEEAEDDGMEMEDWVPTQDAEEWVEPAPPVKAKKAAKGRAPEPEPEPRPGEDPVAFATRLALEQVAERQRADLEDRQARRGEGALRMSPTDQVRMGLSPYFPVLPDMAEMVDSEGKSLVKPGWVPRWVRTRDTEGRPTSRRLRQFYLMGALDVLDEEGKPLEDILGKAIQIPPQAYAAWILHKSSSGAFDGSPYVANAEQLAGDINRKARRQIISVRPMGDHGSEIEEGAYGS